MNQAAAGIALGLLSLHWWLFIPGFFWFITALMIAGVVSYYSRTRLLIWATVGALLAGLSAISYSAAVKTIPVEPGNITIVGQVSSLLNEKIPSTKIDFIIVSLNTQPVPFFYPLRVRLDWPQAPELKQGETWQLRVKLRRPYGRLNSAGFDAEQYYVGHGFHGRGTVKSGHKLTPAYVREVDHSYDSRTLRQQVFDRAMVVLADKRHMSYLIALGFGVRDALGEQDWLRLRDSGLAHLMAISGLHIGLAMLLGWGLGSKVKALLPERNCFVWLPLWCGLWSAFGYAWLAGFSLPTQRALLMSSIVMVLIRFRAQWAGWQVFIVALASCLVLNPLGSYAAGFWMSFAAVMILYLANLSGMRTQPSAAQTRALWWSKVKVLALLQCALLVFMLPLQWQWFGGVSLFAPVINFFAVPWVSILTVPLVLAAISTLWWPGLSNLFWLLADLTLYPVMWLADLSAGTWWAVSSRWLPYIWGIMVGSLLLWFLPWRSFKWLHLSVILVITSWRAELFVQSAVPETLASDWKIEMLDVGHGLAILIERNDKAVLYDTGERWEQGSIASAVIEPVLRDKGIYQLDGLILSHADGDHAGGARQVIKRLQPGWKRSSDYRDGFLACIKDTQWQWEGLDFIVLWPPKRVSRAANPHSCVIQVSDQAISQTMPTTVLFTGDIDAISELLLARQAPDLKPDIMFVPHHGSTTSSTETWLAGMSPDYALVSVAKHNPWQLPSEEVKQRFLAKGTTWLNTAQTGQVSITINSGELDVQRYRQDVSDSWYRRLFYSE
ncbi:DNA internalization-related competence protein ComEC/Rec2 [Photobacterium lipolyticum]|uniref:DNA internalization-related competence protein ComEC/Rec2 n=1 Tax=Photobacterium lipolyticum TaxID=266810 RepID=A0A2T3N489_9GAMM|nr:DNA internalization-related competence protein ComEC/Rec2 [Photobacterium lipolyticum]PSW07281.1 DNA internalization-related competence protein ComEC/Rec2 [Photobacterium lipolyticum]